MTCSDKPFNMDEYLEERFALVERARSAMHFYQDGIAVPFMLKHPFSALFVDMGLGKTVSALTVIAELLGSIMFDRVLIVGPLRVVKRTWPDEIPKWEHTAPLTWAGIRDDELQEAMRVAGRIARAPFVEMAKLEAQRRGLDLDLDPKGVREVIREFLKINAEVIKKATTKESRGLIREAAERNRATIHLINREQLEFLVNAWGKDWPYDVVIIDESSALKDHTTRRFKALRRVRPFIKRMHQLTATPATEGYMGLFAQIYLLDEGKRLGNNITTYRERYFVRGYDGFSWKLRPGAEEEITEKIADICLTLKREDYLKDLKKPIFNPRHVHLTTDERKAYRALETDFITELDDGTEIEAETAAALGSKLLQFASGSVYDDKKVAHHVHDHKVEELQQIVDELCGEPLIVAYWFKPSLQKLKKAFPKAVVMDAEGKAVGPWNKRKIPILLLHPQGAGHGLNLQHGGHHLAFFDIPWSLELYEQTIGRLDRQGQKDAVVLHHLIAKGTADEKVVEGLRDKRNIQEMFFRHLKAQRKRLGQNATEKSGADA